MARKYGDVKYRVIQEAGIGKKVAKRARADVGGAVAAATSERILIEDTTRAVTVTLPASPSFEDEISVVVVNGRLDNVVARNGQRIQGLTEDLTIDVENAAFSLIYVNSTFGWRII
tara:strand:+ start:4674 stop:5021 length:348 start_codon:yes stop_codon:yes gene_type:complete